MADTVTPAPEADNPAGQVADQDTVQGADTLAGQDTLAGADTLAGDEDRVVAPDWREDWRDLMAGGDPKERARLDRFRSPVDVYKSARELEKKMSSGDVKAKLPSDATEEQIAAWRKDNGIPEKPDGYLEKLPSGLVIGDEDKPMLESYLAEVHGANATPEVVAKTLDWYFRQQEATAAAQTDAQADADKVFKQWAEDALRAEWGAEYRGNVNSIMSFLDAAPPTDDGSPLKGLLMGARLSDGTLLGNNPTALKWLASLAQEANPAGFIAPGAGTSQLSVVEDELNGIRKVMRESRHTYDKDEKMQERFRVLLAAQEKLRK